MGIWNGSLLMNSEWKENVLCTCGLWKKCLMNWCSGIIACSCVIVGTSAVIECRFLNGWCLVSSTVCL